MATPPVILAARIDPDRMKDFDALAKVAGLDRAGYLKLWVALICRLKREHALTAITSIPTEMLKDFPGRPTDETAGKLT